MVYGWFGFFYEFYKIISFFIDFKSYGLGDEYVFEVICFCIFGYGFLEAFFKKGTGIVGGYGIFCFSY